MHGVRERNYVRARRLFVLAATFVGEFSRPVELLAVGLVLCFPTAIRHGAFVPLHSVNIGSFFSKYEICVFFVTSRCGPIERSVIHCDAAGDELTICELPIW